MELFERVKQVAGLAGSETKLASRLNLPQTTFNGYLKASRQDNLWPLLPKILEMYPQVRRDWLYFGEGEMLDGTGDGVHVPPLRTALPSMKAALAREAETGGSDIETLRAENNTLKDKLIAALEENTRLHERIHSLNGSSCEGEDAHWGFRDKEDKPATSAIVALGVPPGGN